MYEFDYHYMKPKYASAHGENLRLCYMDTSSFVYDINTDDFYEAIAGPVEARFDTKGCSINHPLPIGKNKKVIGLTKEELGARIITEFVALTPKLYTYKTLSGSRDKKCKELKKCVMKPLNFDDYKQCLLAGRKAFRKQLLFHSKLHKVHMFKVNKLALRMTLPFAAAHLEIFHCMHHPVILKSYLYFTFCFTLNALSKRTSK